MLFVARPQHAAGCGSWTSRTPRWSAIPTAISVSQGKGGGGVHCSLCGTAALLLLLARWHAAVRLVVGLLLLLLLLLLPPRMSPCVAEGRTAAPDPCCCCCCCSPALTRAQSYLQHSLGTQQMLRPPTPTQKQLPCYGRLTFSLFVVYHLPGSTNICLPEISTIAYVSGAGWLCSVGLGAAATFCSATSASAAAVGPKQHQCRHSISQSQHGSNSSSSNSSN